MLEIYKPGVAQELPRLGQRDHRGCESCATEGIPSQPVLDGETLAPQNKIKIKGHQKEKKKSSMVALLPIAALHFGKMETGESGLQYHHL